MPLGASPEPGRELTLGERLDLRAELDEQTFEAMGGQLEEHKARIAALEGTVALLGALLLGTGREADRAG